MLSNWMKKMKKIVLLTFLGLIASNSYAGLIEYGDRATWESNTTSITNIDFEGYVSSDYEVYSGSDAGVTFTGPNSIFVVDETYAESGGLFSLGTGDVIFSYANGIEATLPSNITSIGVDLGGYSEPLTTFDITLSTGEIFSSTFSNPSGGFWGITTDVAIASILFDPTSSFIIMDNFSFGDSSVSVPEPASLALLSLGLAGLGFSRKKKAA